LLEVCPKAPADDCPNGLVEPNMAAAVVAAVAAAEEDLEAAVEEDLGAPVEECFFFLFLGSLSRSRSSHRVGR
jgi:hypothetical protein